MRIEHNLKPSEVKTKGPKWAVSELLESVDLGFKMADLFKKDRFGRMFKRNALTTKTIALILQNPKPEDLQRVDRRRK